MAVRNRDIVEILNEVADLLAILDANSFRIRSYRNAARTVGRLDEQVADLVERGDDLASLPDVGSSIAGKLEEIVESGGLGQLDELRDEMNAEVTELLEIRNLGPAGARKLYRELGVSSPSDLIEAAEEGRIAGLDGFGEKTQAQLLESARRYLRSGARERLPLGEADEIVKPLIDYLRSRPGVDRAVAAGSYRRRRETIGDLDIVAVCDVPDEAMDAFVDYERVRHVVSHGPTRSTVELLSGLHVDLRVVGAESFGSALCYFTGSKAHNVALRRRAQERDLKINEYGVFDGGTRVAGGDEASVYASVELPVVPAVLREDRGELDAAANDRLPRLVDIDDLRGDLHMHTDATDGSATIREMAEAAAERGYEYIAITDHSKRVSMAGGLDADGVRRQLEAIRDADGQIESIRILAGIEVDILRDGSLDLPDDLLAELDLVVASVHYDLDLDERAMTDRIVAAITDHPVSILGHPTGRVIGSRDPYALDLARVLEAAAAAGVALEVNAHPERLDLPDRAIRAAINTGARIAISTDAHAPSELCLIGYGVDTARRGWASAADVVNTRSVDQLASALRGG